MQTARILQATSDNFPRLVLENSRRGLVVVDFWSPAAGPSLRQRDTLSALAGEFGGRFLLATVDIDQEAVLASAYGVKSIPSFKLFRHGKVIEEVRGVQPQADYRTIFEKHLGIKRDVVLGLAARAWRGGQREKALQLLADGAVAEPDNLALPAQLAKFLIQLERIADAQRVLTALPGAARDTPEIAALLAHLDFMVSAAEAPAIEELEERLQADPADHSSRFQFAAVCLINDDYDGCLGALMALLRHDGQWQEGRARRALMAVFEMLGPDHELVRGNRIELCRLIH